MIHRCEGFFGTTDGPSRLPQPFKGLRCRHLMDHMQIDVKQLSLPFFSCDDMPIP